MGNVLGAWTRSKVTAALTVALVVATGSMARPSDTQETAGVGNGTAKATAVLLKVAPGVGALELGITSGVAVAETTNAVAQAQSQAVDLGLIGTTLTAEGCSSAVLKPSDLPQPLRVDNRGGDLAESRDEIPIDGTLLGGGRLTASATGSPQARSSATGVGVVIDPLLRIGAGTSIAETDVFPGEGREAHAVVETTIDIGGLVKLKGLRWEARHRTGSQRVVEGSFEIGGVDVAMIPDLAAEVEPVEKAVNALLELSGISIDFPKVEKVTEPTDLVRVTPLRIVLRDSPLGKIALGPVLDLTRSQREQLFDDLTASICEAAAVLLLGDVGVSVVAGTGFLAIDIGGVEAISGEFAVGDAIGIPEAVPPAAVTPVSPPVAPVDTSSGDTGGAGITPVTPANEQAAEVVAQPAADIGPIERVCESVHPFDWPSCSQGAAPMAGLIGLLGTGAMFGLDYRRQRIRPDGVSAEPEAVA